MAVERFVSLALCVCVCVCVCACVRDAQEHTHLRQIDGGHMGGNPSRWVEWDSRYCEVRGQQPDGSASLLGVCSDSGHVGRMGERGKHVASSYNVFTFYFQYANECLSSRRR